MAHHSAAKKAIRQSAARRIRNRSYKSRIRTAMKQFETAATSEDKQMAFKEVQKSMDQAARKKVVSKNSASRTVSRMARKIEPATPASNQ